MKTFKYFLLFGAVFLFISSKTVAAKLKNTRVVIIALDGISVEGFEKAKLPNINQLLAQGTLSKNTRIVMPSVTLPNWTSHLTGSDPEQHGTVDNGWQIDKYTLPPVVMDYKGYYPSIFKLLKEQLPTIKTAFYYNWLNLIYPYNKDYMDEICFLQNDEYKQNYDKALNFIVNNKQNPNFIFLYSGHTDHAGHNHGWMSPEYISSIEETDKEIGFFIDKLKAQGLYDDTYFLFLSDHGGIKNGHGGVTPTEMEVPWGITGPGICKAKLMTEPNNTMNTAAIIAHLFGCKAPYVWTGKVPTTLFQK
jgi:predicted AlkP superfamily pyrophosphatase or phosphodiesterase